MAISIYDIAKKAKVAPSTVSRALQNHPRIGEKTKKRIQELAREMDYVPSTVAKSLIANRTWTIGVLAPSIADPFMGRVVEGVEHVAIESGYNVFLSTSQNDRQREIAIVEVFQQRRVDGIIVLSSHLFDRQAHYYDRTNVPIVIINEQEPGETIHFVAVDDVHAARKAVEYLVELGHRRIGYVGAPNRPKSNRYRLKGYQDALKAAGIPFDPALVFESKSFDDHTMCGEASVEVLQAAGATAAFCYNDTTAIGVLAACYQRGLAVPGALSVIGFDDIEIAAYTIPPLTTIRQPRFDLGQRAMRMMLEALNGKAPENQHVQGELIVRQTAARLISS